MNVERALRPVIRLKEHGSSANSLDRILRGEICQQEDVTHLVRTVGFKLDRSCNLGCADCYTYTINPTRKPEVPSQRLIQSVLTEAPSATASIGGGEPLLFPCELEEMIHSIQSMGRMVGIATNGLVLGNTQKEMLRRLNRKVGIGISFDVMHAEGVYPSRSLSSDDIDRYVRKVTYNIEWLRQYGFEVTVHTVIRSEIDGIFFEQHALPLLSSRLVSRASIAPNMFANVEDEAFAEARRLVTKYKIPPGELFLSHLDALQGDPNGMQMLRLNPFSLVEVTQAGVTGPTPYSADKDTEGHASIIDMINAHQGEWREIINHHPLELTSLNAALAYATKKNGEIRPDYTFWFSRLKEKSLKKISA